jgi:Tfp pilus assembly protein FimT
MPCLFASRRLPPASRRPCAEARSDGFSLVDIMVTLAVVGLLMAIAVPSIGTSLVSARADSAMRQVYGDLREARDTAMTQRRTMEVQFIAPNEVRTVRIDQGVRTTVTDTFLEHGMQFVLETGVSDTPDAFGRTRAIDFGGITTVWFLADGSLVDATNQPLSGTVFMGVPNRPLSARAVTVLGPTGRVMGYRWDSRVWR